MNDHSTRRDDEPILRDQSHEDLIAGARHLEDLEIFVGQRSRMHPGPGWALVLSIVRRELVTVRTELRRRESTAL
jgi:hypothetical protein